MLAYLAPLFSLNLMLLHNVVINIRLFQKLCQLLEGSGSKSIFTSLISVYCREENHPMKTSLVLCLRNVQAKLDLLDMAYEYTLGAKGKGPKLSNVEPS